MRDASRGDGLPLLRRLQRRRIAVGRLLLPLRGMHLALRSSAPPKRAEGAFDATERSTARLGRPVLARSQEVPSIRAPAIPPAAALPLSDSRSDATTRRPCGCSPRPAGILSPPRPRMRKVARAFSITRTKSKGRSHSRVACDVRSHALSDPLPSTARARTRAVRLIRRPAAAW